MTADYVVFASKYVDHDLRLTYTRWRLCCPWSNKSSSWYWRGELTTQKLAPSDIAQLIVEVALEKLASDIIMLDLRGLASFTDYFVIMSADSSRLIQALEDDISTTLKDSNLSIHRREGSSNSGWVLMDCSDVIVHIFSPDEREFFGLERLWARAPQVVRIL